MPGSGDMGEEPGFVCAHLGAADVRPGVCVRMRIVPSEAHNQSSGPSESVLSLGSHVSIVVSFDR